MRELRNSRLGYFNAIKRNHDFLNPNLLDRGMSEAQYIISLMLWTIKEDGSIKFGKYVSSKEVASYVTRSFNLF